MRKFIIKQVQKISYQQLCLLVLFLMMGNTESSATNGTPSIFDVLNYQELVEVELELDLVEIKNNRRSREAFKATFSFNDQNGLAQEWAMKVEQRGKFRRGRCEAMPPLKLNFKKKALKAAGLATFDDLKLVTHCVEEGKDAKELLLKEYLAYKLYNTVSDESFRVQFLAITYKDVNTGATEKQWGFLIEDTAQLRARLNLEKTEKVYGLTAADVDGEAMKRVALFQYLIGNADWNIETGRNVKLLKRGDKIIPVPYDFDFSGLVNAPYARLNGEFNQTSLQERFYLGFPEDVTDLDATLNRYVELKKELIKTVKDFDLLSGKSRRSIVSYLRSFYKTMDQINLPPTAEPKLEVVLTGE